MVQSVLSSDVNYPEIKKLDPEDRSYSASIYEIDINDVNVMIALGQPKYTYLDSGIIYFPIYLVKGNTFDKQIGVFESLSSMIPQITDEDGEVDIAEMGEPLVYSFVDKNPKILLDAAITKSEDTSDSHDEDDDEESIVDDKIDELEVEVIEDKEEPEDEEDNVKEAKKEEEPLTNVEDEEIGEEHYGQQEGDEWIQVFMKNRHYQITDNEGGGDCLFAAIRDGLRSTRDDSISVADMRKMLADAVTDDLYQNYLDHYKMHSEALDNSRIELKKLADESKRLKAQMKRLGRDAVKEAEIRLHASEAAERVAILRNDRDLAQEMLNEFRWMKGITSLEGFRNKIQTCAFWGDTWAISTLERLLKVKLIIFSENHFDEGDNDGVLLCTELGDNVLEREGVFKPDFYVMLSYNGSHYELITYKGKGALSFDSIPEEVKQMIVDKCLERHAGPYSLIPEFNELSGRRTPVEEAVVEIGVDHKDKLPAFREMIPEDDMSDEGALSLLTRANGNIEKAINMYFEGNTGVDTAVERAPELESMAPVSSDKLVFYSRSAAKPLPGKGMGEKAEPSDFKTLASFKDWRKKLDDSYRHSIQIEEPNHPGLKINYPSVRHYLLSRRVANDKSMLMLFDRESKSEIASNVEAAEAAVSKSGLYRGKLLRPVDVEVTGKLNEDDKQRHRKTALEAKFKAPEMASLLKATGDSKLYKHVPRSIPMLDSTLMAVRSNM